MTWLGPFSEFPRQMGYPARNGIVYSLKEFLHKVNLYNGKTKDVFTSLYAFDKINSDGTPEYESARISHIYFDLDGPNCVENIWKLFIYFAKKDSYQIVLFSGGGFHLYVATESSKPLKDKKSAIFNAVIDAADKLQMKVGISENDDIDAHTIGNVAQLVRVPNTYNLKRHKFCVPISDVDFVHSLERCQVIAQHQNGIPFERFIYGSKYLDLTPYDREPIERYRIPAIDAGDSVGIENIDVDKFYPCIKELLTKNFNKGHRQRYYIITYCKDIGLSLKDTVLLLKKYLDPKTFNHCVYEERQPNFIYRRADLQFPSCEKLRKDGLCIEGCKI